MNYIERYGIEPAEHPVDASALLSELCATLKSLVVVPQHSEVAIALWTIMTYLIEPAEDPQCINTAPILSINSPDRQCGKSTVKAILALIVARPKTVSNLSDAVLYRIMEAQQPTLLIDEADTFIASRPFMIGILNDGYTPTGTVMRMGGNGFQQLEEFSTWGAKSIIGIGGLPETLSSRCIHIRMKRKHPDEHVTRLGVFTRQDPEYFLNLRRKILRFVIDNRAEIEAFNPELIHQLDDRQQDNWDPLLKIASVAGQEWINRTVEAAITMKPVYLEESNEGILLLEDLYDLFVQKRTDRLTTDEILAALNTDELKPWFYKNYRKGISPRELAGLLKPYDVRPRDIRQSGKVMKGYVLQDLQDPFLRYLGKSATGQQAS